MRAISFIFPILCIESLCDTSNLSTRVPDSQGVSIGNQIQRDLGPQLSPGATLYCTDDAAFRVASTRWSAAQNPDFTAVIVPATAQDVAIAVRFANARGIPFLAVNRAHGTTTDMSNLHHGLNIYLRNLNFINIAPDGKSACMGGGVYGDQVIRYLASKGKIAATGGCACTSVPGPALGGGFNRYQGFHGLMLDNILSLTLVTANGTLLTTSATQYPDLFWAMRGAGHNLGIVTSLEYRIFEPSTSEWWVASLTFCAREKMDDVFQILGELNQKDSGEQDKRITFYTVFAADDTEPEPILIVNLYFAGPTSDALSIIQPLLNLNPKSNTNHSVPYTEVADAVGTGMKSPVCNLSGTSAATFPIGLKGYEINAIHQVYEIFTELVTQYPDFRGSAMQFEAYPMGEVKSVDEKSTAYAHRRDSLLGSLLTLYTPSFPASTNDAITHTYGTKIRQALSPSAQNSTPSPQFNAYVNYAYGDESTESIYGYEEWRLEKLRALKKEWDPRGVFRWYHPIR